MITMPHPHSRCLGNANFNYKRCAFLLCLVYYVSVSVALAPPHPDWTDFEPVQVMRERLNITFNYVPKHYPIEQCRFMTEEECRILDESAGVAKERRRRERELNPSKGSSIKILVLLMYFPEHASIKSKLPQVSYFEELLNGKGTSAVNPAGSLKEFFLINSLKKFNVEFVIQDWSQASNSESYYANGNAGRGGDMLRIESIFRSKLEAMDKAGFDFAPFDSDVNGYLDGVMAIHSGMASELGKADCGTDFLQRVWSQCIRGPVNGGWTSSNMFYTLDGFTVAGATTKPLCSGTTRVYTPTTIAIQAHELGHSWQLDDYYDQSNDPTAGVAGIGNFDIMCQAYGWTYNGNLPGYYGAYSKIISGWATPTSITQDGFYAIQPIEVSGQVYKISDPYPAGEYLLIESRMPYRWSSDWPTRGIIIYHVDEKAGLQTDRGYPGKSGWPTKHYRVAVLQKDGNYDIEKAVNLGDATDFWVMGDVLGPGPSKWPNTDSYQTKQTSIGLSIKITTTPSLVTQFQITGLKKWFLAPALFAAQSFDNSTTTATTTATNGTTTTATPLQGNDAIAASTKSTDNKPSSSASSSSWNDYSCYYFCGSGRLGSLVTLLTSTTAASGVLVVVVAIGSHLV